MTGFYTSILKTSALIMHKVSGRGKILLRHHSRKASGFLSRAIQSINQSSLHLFITPL